MVLGVRRFSRIFALTPIARLRIDGGTSRKWELVYLQVEYVEGESLISPTVVRLLTPSEARSVVRAYGGYFGLALRGPHTANIHTLITLGISIRAKPLVCKARKHRPCAFASHRPLHFSLSGVSLRCPRTRTS
jgi:hypothetical protein